MADTEDYSEEVTPTAHAASHEDVGTDEISIAGLAGEPLELAAHALLPTVHQDAPALILTHKGDASAHHAKYTDAEAQAVADTQIAEHALLPTVHQDAPALILAHKGDVDAHHPVFVGLQDNAGTQMWPQAGLIQFTDDGKVNIDDLMPGVLLASIDEDQFTHLHSHADLTNITANDHHAKYTDAEAQAVADTQIGIHAADADAHHTYEEGTWTPVLSRYTTPSTHTYTYQQGHYTKIGNLVTCSFRILISATTAAGAGPNTITGFPFTAGGPAHTQIGVIGYNDVLSASDSKSFRMSATTAFLIPPGPTQSYLTEPYNDGTHYLSGTITYMI